MKYLALLTLAAQNVFGFDYEALFKNSSELIISGPYNDHEMGRLRNICGNGDSVEAKCHAKSHPEVYAKSRAALRIRNGNQPHCTAWLVGDQGHVLTNWHCIKSQAQANNLKFEAMAEANSCKLSCKSALSCSGKFIHSKPLKFIKTGGSLQDDYTLLQLRKEDRKAAVAKYGYLKLRRSGPVLGERIYIPQHPRGWGKRIAMRDGNNWARIINVNAGNFNGCGVGQVGYKADTQGGSSGSPVIGVSDNAVVAIHHCGGCSNYANTATHMDSMLKGLKKHLPKSAFK